MATTQVVSALDRRIDELIYEARLREVAPSIVARAATATRSALATVDLESDRMSRRARAYFWAVVRRGLVREAGSPATARMVLESVVADLRASGRDSAEVWRELQTGWVGKVPGEVLEEYRVRLCA